MGECASFMSSRPVPHDNADHHAEADDPAEGSGLRKRSHHSLLMRAPGSVHFPKDFFGSHDVAFLERLTRHWHALVEAAQLLHQFLARANSSFRRSPVTALSMPRISPSRPLNDALTDVRSNDDAGHD